MAVLGFLDRDAVVPPAVERISNGLLAASVFSWSVLGLVMTQDASRWTVVRLSISVLHVCVAGLLLCRAPVGRPGSTAAMLTCLPSLVLAGVVLAQAPSPDRWPLVANMMFVAGAMLAVAGLMTLGRSFSVFPALRDIVDRGPYRWMRHPAYAGETLMMVACVLAARSWPAVFALICALVSIVARIIVEERLLATTFAYRRYLLRVKWRLIPFVW